MSSALMKPSVAAVVADPVEQPLPVIAAEEDDREVEHLAGLDQGQRLEQLVQGPEAAGEHDEPLRRLHEHRLAGVEVPERDADVEYGFGSCSCGSSMLKPTDRPPASWAPRLAASITPGPPPVTTAKPASAKRRPRLLRAVGTTGSSSRTRAEPKIVTAGAVDAARPPSKPVRNSSAMRKTLRGRLPSCARRICWSWSRCRTPPLERSLDVGRAHGEHEEGGQAEVADGRCDPLPGRHLVVASRPRAGPAPASGARARARPAG